MFNHKVSYKDKSWSLWLISSATHPKDILRFFTTPPPPITKHSFQSKEELWVSHWHFMNLGNFLMCHQHPCVLYEVKLLSSLSQTSTLEEILEWINNCVNPALNSAEISFLSDWCKWWWMRVANKNLDFRSFIVKQKQRMKLSDEMSEIRMFILMTYRQVVPCLFPAATFIGQVCSYWWFPPTFQRCQVQH